MSGEIRIRRAERSDAGLILSLIRELASFEKLLDEVVATEEGLSEHLFGERPAAEALIADLDGEEVGFALYHPNFSTFLGCPGIYLEDLFVREAARGMGVGKALLMEVVKIAHRRGCGRLEWNVLDWNERAIAFYESLGAKIQSEWKLTRMDGGAMAKLVSDKRP